VLASFRKTVAEQAWAEEGQVEIVKAAHPDNAGLIGAAALSCTPDESAVEAGSCPVFVAENRKRESAKTNGASNA
jgi:hypothetical protein